MIGRLVCFRDPIHARAAWDAGRRDEVVQTPAAAPYAGYGGFTNFASPAVRRYNIAIAAAAAEPASTTSSTTTCGARTGRSPRCASRG